MAVTISSFRPTAIKTYFLQQNEELHQVSQQFIVDQENELNEDTPSILTLPECYLYLAHNIMMFHNLVTSEAFLLLRYIISFPTLEEK